jgi:D-lactate dehydrogenase
VRVAIFSSKPYDRRFLEPALLEAGHACDFFEARLDAQTAPLAKGSEALCAFVNDDLCSAVLEQLAPQGIRSLALRSAGFNHVDLAAAKRLGMRVARVPAYSPHSVAEHTVGLMLTLNRKFHRAFNQVREGNFSLDHLLGFDFHGRSVGIVGTGKIGACVARILQGFGMKLLLHDVNQNVALREIGEYVTLDRVIAASDVITLHCPLLPATHHLINAQSLRQMKRGVMLINTSRGGLIDTRAVIDGLKSGQIGYLGLDVYEEEADLFFEDRSQTVIQDDVFMRLLTFPNVVVTSHQAFFTQDALREIARVTALNLSQMEVGGDLENEVALRA